MKEFDWEICKKTRNPGVYQWLKDNWDKPITEKDFVSAKQGYRNLAKGKYLSKRYGPAHLRKEYKNLKETFGFFA